jgi:UDP-4-amino-4,6-dideoxy-N-acetyl-beta-L-altrosamine transaminase
MIPYGRQDISPEDIQAVVDVLQSDFLTQGPVVPLFEQALASISHANHAVVVNSATSALHIACLALGLGPGDLLWTVPNSFVASANCGLYCGARVDFVDIDPLSWNISLSALKAKLLIARQRGVLPKIVVPVHFAGQPSEQEEIWSLAQEFGFKVLEDASHAIGAKRNGEPVGSCRWSHATVFSFHPVKIITAGEGGAVLTNDALLCQQMQLLRSHGITRDSQLLRMDGVAPGWHYEQQQLGFNYRMTDIQAALGLSQLQRLPAFVDQRRALAQRYDALLRHFPVQRPWVAPLNDSAWHLYVVRVPHALPGRRVVYDSLRAAGIGINVHYTPIHLQPYYKALGFSAGDFPEAERHGEEAITLPLYPGLSEAEQDEVVAALALALKA